MEEEIKRILDDHEKRINALEGSPTSEVKKTATDNYKGLAGGIRLLMDEGFLSSSKSVSEIEEELKRNGYHYPQKSIGKLLSVDFMKNNRHLTRMQEANKWKYVIRK